MNNSKLNFGGEIGGEKAIFLYKNDLVPASPPLTLCRMVQG